MGKTEGATIYINTPQNLPYAMLPRPDPFHSSSCWTSTCITNMSMSDTMTLMG